MGNDRKLIVFELNEVGFKVLDDFIAKAPTSHFSRLLSRSAQFVARTPDTIYLHPRTSWPTFHRGVPDTLHGILQYNASTERVDRLYPRLWDVLRAHGRSVGIGASIGAYPVPADTEHVRFYLPEPFAPDPQTFPDGLGTFQRFNLGAVGGSGRIVRKGLDPKLALGVLARSRQLGIGLGTWRRLAAQLALERIRPARIVRRRNCQALLTFDVVMKQLREGQPDFATCFTNHVAASMHRYWAAAFPDDYGSSNGDDNGRDAALEHPVTENLMPADWIATYKGEIAAAMDFADHMLGTLLDFVDRRPSYRLLLMTSMGQQAADATPVKNQVILKDLPKFMARAGFEASAWTKLPGMEPMTNVGFADPGRLDDFESTLRETIVCGQPAAAATVDREGRRLTFSLNRENVEGADFTAQVGGEDVPPEELGLVIEEIQDGAGSTGWHTPNGSAIVYDPARDLSGLQQRETVLTTEFTAAILAGYGIAIPSYMPRPAEPVADVLAGA